MAVWRKVIVSGSTAELANLSVDNNVNVTGSVKVGANQTLNTNPNNTLLSGSFSGSFQGRLQSVLSSQNQANIVSYDTSSGLFFYQSTSSFIAATASYVSSSNVDGPFGLNSILSASHAVTSSLVLGQGSGSFTGSFYGFFSGSTNLPDLTPGTGIEPFIYDGSAIATIAVSGASSLNSNTVTKWDGDSFANSSIYDDGTNVTGSTSLQFSGANTKLTGSFTGSFKGDGSGLTGLVSTLAITGSVGVGSVNLLTQGLSILGTSLEVETSASGQTITIGLPDNVFVSQSLQVGTSLVVTGSAQFNGGATGSFTGSFTGVTNLPDLTQGLGIVPFTYDGSGTATVAVSGAADLSANMIVKWDAVAGKFTTSSITNASNVTINTPGGVLIQQGGLYVTGSSTFHNDLSVQGNLVVLGTASFQNTTSLEIADQFILLNSGSNTFQDSGFIVNTGNAGNSGSAFFLETAGTTVGAPLYGRFAVAGGVLPNATAATADEYAVTTKIISGAPSAAPSWGGTTLGQGNMHIDTSNGDIWIYS